MGFIGTVGRMLVSGYEHGRGDGAVGEAAHGVLGIQPGAGVGQAGDERQIERRYRAAKPRAGRLFGGITLKKLIKRLVNSFACQQQVG